MFSYLQVTPVYMSGLLVVPQSISPLHVLLRNRLKVIKCICVATK